MPTPEATPAPTSSAAYLALRMCADKGYSLGTVAEAEALAAACDIVLTKTDDMTFQIVCIIDRETEPNKKFDLTREAVLAAGKACLKYTGTINSAKLPVGVQIWEVGRNVASQSDLQRLKSITRTLPGLAKVVVSGWAIDTSSGHVASTARFNGFFMGRRYLERVLREPRLAEIARPPAPVLNEGDGTPWVTISMLALLAIVFLAEFVFAARPSTGPLSPDIMTLVATGGLMRPLVDDGEWHRLFTSAFLHADFFHFLLNGVALFFAGVVLENLLGRAWLIALFVIGALGGAALSYALNPPTVVSVGASGAIMALLAAAFVTSFRIPTSSDRIKIQISLMQILIPSMIPLATHRLTGRIDFAAHVGGAVVGAIIGVLLLRTWPLTSPLPRFRKVACLIAAVGIVLFIGGFALVLKNHAKYVDAAAAESHLALLIPDDQLPKSDEESLTRAQQLVAGYPRDPRARLFHAVQLAQDGDTSRAQAELRRGLEEKEILQAVFPDGKLETAMRSFLAELQATER